jgi:hypothetical protein
MHVHKLNLGMHIYIIFGSLYKICHNYFFLRIISMI